MNKLPIEIIFQVFKFLHQQDIAECMTVCHKWNCIIKNYATFDTICLNTDKQLLAFVSSMKRDLPLSGKIKRLVINRKCIAADNISVLLLAISKVQELYFYGSNEADSFPCKNPRISHPWSKTIREIQENASDTFTTSILKTGPCPALAEISINGAGAQLGAAFISLLSNAPSLKALSLTKYVISFEHMELMHDVLPQLSTLMIYHSVISNTIPPAEIRPAASITSLTFEYTEVSAIREYINFNKYLTMKYPQVTKMSYDIFQSALRSNDGIKRRASFAILIDQIGSHLTSLKIGEDMKCNYIISVVDDSNCRIEELDLCMPLNHPEVYQLVRSKQAQHIKTLTIPFLSKKCLEDLQALSALTELNLSGTSNSSKIEMNTLMNSVGNTLVTLRLNFIKVMPALLSTRQYPSMRYLLIKHSKVANSLDHFISQSFPKLCRLVIDDIYWKGSTFYLGDLALSYLELRIAFPSTNPHVLISTISNNDKRWYKAKPAHVESYGKQVDPFTLPVVKTFPFNENQGLPYITFVCHSLSDFFLVNLSTRGY